MKTTINVAELRAALQVAVDRLAAMFRAMRAALTRAGLAFRDFAAPPSRERRWIRMYAQIQRAEAELWLERHLRAFERQVLG